MFSDKGHHCIYLLTDFFVYATIVYKLAEAFGFVTDCPMGLDGCLTRVREVRDFFDSVEDQNFRRTGRLLDAQGAQGNVSLVVRKSLRNFVIGMDQRIHNFSRLNIPDIVQEAQQAKAITTLAVECFFPLMRKR